MKMNGVSQVKLYPSSSERPFVGLFFCLSECISYESRDRNHIEQHLENSRMDRSIQLLQNLSAACRVPSPLFGITLNWPHFDMWVSGYVAIAFSIGNKFCVLN